MVKLKRAYEKPARTDGTRILVERLWPRGLTKERAAVDLWLRDIAPSPDLRKWYGHDPAKWPEFRRRYLAELERAPEQAALETLWEQAAKGTVTLVYAAHDEKHNSAVVLQEYLDMHEPRSRRRRAA